MKGKDLQKDLPVSRPKTLAEAKRAVEDTLQFNRWNDAERMRYFVSLGLEAKKTSELSKEDLKVILADFEKFRMIIFEDKGVER